MRDLTPPLILLGALLVAPGARVLAQPGPVGPPAPQRPGVLYDRVLGFLGDDVILESNLRAELQAQITAAENEGRTPTRAEIEAWRRGAQARIIREQALVQAAKTLPGTTREAVDRMVDSVMQDFQREQVERAGSWNKLTEELGILGKTWDTIREERRTNTLAALAEQTSLLGKYRDRVALMVTPRDMRRFYDENLEQFVEQESADIEIVAIPSSSADAAARAAAAAEAWRVPGATAESIADRFGGVALEPRRRVRDDEGDPNRPEIRAFAGQSQEGEVSPPTAMGRTFWLLRCVQRREARHDTFDDPQVQAWIVEQLTNRETQRLRVRLYMKSQDRHQFRPIGRR
ncbi:MAG: peptidyl-prolyl cis-trans isomerase [Planctomycetota bacterium]